MKTQILFLKKQQPTNFEKQTHQSVDLPGPDFDMIKRKSC